MIKNRKKTLIIYWIAFYIIWALFEFVFKDIISQNVPDTIIAQIIKTGVIKNLVWILPAVLLVHTYGDDVHIPLKEMFSLPKKSVGKYILILLAFTAYILIEKYMTSGQLAISPTWGADKIIIILFVGITEEMVFRGWLLNAVYTEDKKCELIFINSLLFLSIHFPKWIHDGIFVSNILQFGFIGVIILSFIFSYSFVRSRSIVIPVILHMYWDFLEMMLL